MSSITSEITAGSGAHGDTPRIKQEEESYRDLANAVPNGNQQQERLSASPQIKQEASAAPYEAQNTATVAAVAAGKLLRLPPPLLTLLMARFYLINRILRSSIVILMVMWALPTCLSSGTGDPSGRVSISISFVSVVQAWVRPLL